MIKITDKYYIKPDDDQYTLSYHHELSGAVRACMRRLQLDTLGGIDVNLSEAVKVLGQLNKDFERMLEGKGIL